MKTTLKRMINRKKLLRKSLRIRRTKRTQTGGSASDIQPLYMQKLLELKKLQDEASFPPISHSQQPVHTTTLPPVIRNKYKYNEYLNPYSVRHIYCFLYKNKILSYLQAINKIISVKWVILGILGHLQEVSKRCKS